MGRHREFDEAEVLDAAMHCFWARGYEAASVRDLASEMHITGASLYNAFGDKRSLYRRALERYASERLYERVSRLECGLPPFEAVRAFFHEVVERSANDTEHRGCMLVNAALEAGSDDPELRQAVKRELQVIEEFFRRCVAAGQAAGTIMSALPADNLAQMLLSVLLGIRVLARTDPGRAALAGPVGAALAVLAGQP